MSQETASILPQWKTRHVVMGTILVFAIAWAFWSLYQLWLVVLILFTAIVIGTAVRPLAQWLQKRGLPPLYSAILLYILILIGLVVSVLMIIPVVFEQTTALLSIVPVYYDGLRNFLLQSPNLILQQISWRLPPQLSLLNIQGPEAEVGPASYSLDTFGLVIKSVFITIATFMLSLYWTLDGQRAIQSLSILLPLRWREQARELAREMESRVGAFVRGQALLCVAIGLLSLAAYLLIGLPYVLVLALFAGIMEAIPYLGPVLGALPAIIVAITLGPDKVIWVVVATLIIQQLENTLLMPRIMKESVGVNSIVALLAIITLGALLGVIGALLAIPITAIVQILIDRFVLSIEGIDEEQPVGRGRLGRLHYQVRDLLQDIRKQARYGDEDFVETGMPMAEEVEAIAADLESILVQGSSPEVRL